MHREGTQTRFPGIDRDAAAGSGGRSMHQVLAIRREATLPRIGLALIAALSLLLGLFNIGQEGYANAYYAAAVRSMLENWHAFFFGSFDAKGFVTVDKPAMGLWIQTASAWIFGFYGWSILLPQALASVGSVLLIYKLARDAFGQSAGLIAAFALAIAPMNVAVARNNTADGLLTFTMLLGALCLMRAARKGSVWWLAAAMALVGVGFNIKMMEAYLVLPAFVLVYLLAANASFWRRIWQLGLSAIVLLAVSFSWATAVALTPASERPYIGSTQDNSIFSLIFGYNGINRLLPRGWSIFGITSSTTSAFGGGAGGRGIGGTSENGPQGVFRLLDTQLGGQIGWLIPLAVIGLLAAWGCPRLRNITDRQRALLLFGSWAVTEIVFFSVAGFYHRYYLSTLSPAIAALTGAGLVALWNTFRNGGGKSVLLPLALIVTAASQYRLLADYPTWKDRLGPLLIAGAAVSLAGFLAYSLLTRKSGFASSRSGAALRAVVLAAVLTLFAAPAAWSYTTTTRPGSGTSPVGGPPPGASFGNRSFGGFGGGGSSFGSGTSGSAGSPLIPYLEANQGSAAYLLGVTNSQAADQIIIATGKPVMAMGGFSGSDPILTVDALKAMIANGEIRFFTTSGRGSFGRGGGAASTSAAGGQRNTGSVVQWITTNCKIVSSSAIAAASKGSTTSTTTLTSGVYDCQGAAPRTP